MSNKLHSFKGILGFSILASYLCSVAYVLVLLYFLPPSDEAKKAGVLVLLDPFVQTCMLLVALLFGIIGSFVAWKLLRNCDLLMAGVACLIGTSALYVIVRAHLVYSMVGGALVCTLICFGIWLQHCRRNGQQN